MKIFLALLCLAGTAAAQFSPANVANFNPRAGAAAPPAALVFSDFNFADNALVAKTVTNVVSTGPTYTLTFTNPVDELIAIAGNAATTFTLRFQCTGSPDLITNWTHSIRAGSYFGTEGEVRVTLDAWTTGYGTGSHLITDDDTPVDVFNPTPDATVLFPLGSGSLTPNAHLYFTVQIMMRSFDDNDVTAALAYSLTLNSP